MIEYFSYGIIALGFFIYAHVDTEGTIYTHKRNPIINSVITYLLAYIFWLPVLFLGFALAIYMEHKK